MDRWYMPDGWIETLYKCMYGWMGTCQMEGSMDGHVQDRWMVRSLYFSDIAQSVNETTRFSYIFGDGVRIKG